MVNRGLTSFQDRVHCLAMNPIHLPNPVFGEHPGIHLEAVIAARGWNKIDLAFILGRPAKGLSLIFSQKCGISPEMSKALGHALDLPQEYFANLQQAYDLAHAQDPNPSVSLRAKLRSQYPIREMIKRGWLNDSDATNLEIQLARFFEVQVPDEIPYLAHSAKKSSYEEREIPPAQLAWLFRVRQLAKTMVVRPYSRDALIKSVERMKQMLLSPEEARHVPRLLSECGVRFVMVETLPKSKIDGVAFWLDKRSPVIGLSARYDRLDNFWFVLRHEIEHILNGHGQDVAMVDSELDSGPIDCPSAEVISEEERIANSAAADFCVPSDKMQSFIRRKHPFFYEKDIVAFSHINRIHPGLVVGQIQRRTGRYDYLRSYQVKVRNFVAPNAIADGWGQTIPVTQ
jgi:HTH-type transcriptional regulator / antitoxin HigA